MIERIVDETPELGSAERADLRRGPLDRRHARRDPAPDRAAPRAGDRLPRADRARARATRCALGFAQAALRRADDPRRRPDRAARAICRRSSRRSPCGRAELVNGSRLVYDLEPGAMRFLNLIGNKVFSLVFSALLGQPVKDTLCGTKVLERQRLRADRGRPLVLRRLRPVRRLRPAARRGAAQPEDRRPARALPRARLRRDEDLALPPRLAAAADGRVRLSEAEDRDLPPAPVAAQRRSGCPATATRHATSPAKRTSCASVESGSGRSNGAKVVAWFQPRSAFPSAGTRLVRSASSQSTP